MTSGDDPSRDYADPTETDLAIIRARLAAIVDSSHDAILAKDLHGIITAWNPAAERLYGYSAPEIIGQPIDTIIPSEFVGESEHILSEVIAGRAVAPYDTERVTKSGARVHVSIAVSPIRDSDGTVVGASTIARDITGRMEADAERAWTQMLVSQSADAIVAIDDQGLISTWNPAAEQLFGYTAAEALGRVPQEVVVADDPKAQIEISESVLGLGRTRQYEAKRRHRNGDELTVQISIAPLNAGASTPTGAVVSIRDVTATRAAEARVEAAELRETELLRELEQSRRLESVGQLAGGIAHDFNNLLGVILNLATFVASAVPVDSQARIDATEIGETATRAATLTRQLLIFSRRDVVEPEVFNAGALAGDLRSFLTRALGEAIQLSITGDDDLWNVNMDRGQLEQVIVNLAVNGRDAMSSGGRLMIETRNTVVDEEFARTRVGLEPGHYVTLTVSDTGTGMPPDVIERAFEPYFTTKSEGQGTGLGLATVYGIATKAGGRVALYSELGRGTSVHVHLPATDAVAARTSATSPAYAAGTGQRILVVEDANDVRTIAERILLAAGYVVVTASSAAEALDAIAGPQPIDLVLTDVVMPHTTGTELVGKIRQRTPGMKVVFMSGYTHAMLTEEVLAHPGSSFIEKPFTADQLRRKVSEVLLSDAPSR